MPEREYDLVVIGAGPGGYVCAIRAAQLGLSVAVVEKEAPGGVCLNIGCIPSKALIHQASLFEDGRAALEAAGAKVDLAGFDYAKPWKKSRDAADRLSKGVRFLLKKNKIEYIEGEASLSGPGKVKVSGAARPQRRPRRRASPPRPSSSPPVPGPRSCRASPSTKRPSFPPQVSSCPAIFLAVSQSSEPAPSAWRPRSSRTPSEWR